MGSIMDRLAIEHTRGVFLLHVVSLIALKYDARECRRYIYGTCRFSLDIVPELRSVSLEIRMVELPPLRFWVLTIHGRFF